MSGLPAVSSETLGATLATAFAEAEDHFLRANQKGPIAVRDFEATFVNLLARARTALDGDSVPKSDQHLIYASFSRLRIITGLLRDLEHSGQQHKENIKAGFQAILSDSSNEREISSYSKGQTKRPTPSKEDTTLTEATKFKPCADYFLAHFSSPYPSNDAKSAMAAQIGVKVPSVTMWFTNNRRRSGWNTVMQDHADNNKERMRHLVDDVLSTSKSHPIPEPVCEAVQKAKAFISRLAGPEISDVFREALAMKPMTAEQVEEYQKQRHAMQKKVSEFVKNAQGEREAHQARKAARAQTRADMAARRATRAASTSSRSAPAERPSFGKRKRTDENGVSEVDRESRPTKRANLAVDDALDVSPDPSSSTLSKRKRSDGIAGDAVAGNGERLSKKARTSSEPRERKPRARYVLDDGGNPRKLRRKAPFRFVSPKAVVRAAPSNAESLTHISPSNSSSKPVIIDVDSPSLLIVKKRKHHRNTESNSPINTPSPRLPTTHKRRKVSSKEMSRSTSIAEGSKSANSQSRKQRKQGRAASAPTATREIPFLTPDVSEALRRAQRSVSDPTAIPPYGAYVDGDAMFPPLTEEQLAAGLRKIQNPIPNLNMSHFSRFPHALHSSPMSANSSNSEQITINLNNASSPFTSMPQFPSDFMPSTASTSVITNNEIDLLQAMMPQPTNDAPMDQGVLDYPQLQLQLDQLQAETAIYQSSLAPLSSLPITASNNPQVLASFDQMLMQSFGYMAQPQQQPQVLASAPDPFSPGANVDLSAAAAVVPISNSYSSSISAASSFSSDYSSNTSFSVPSPIEYAPSNSPTYSHSPSPARSVSPAAPSSMEMYAELERRKRELEEKQRVAEELRQEAERHEQELQLFAAACAHSMVHSDDAAIL